MNYQYTKVGIYVFKKGGSMKKAIKIIVSAVVITAVIVLSVIPFSAVEIKRYYGDLNNDAYITTQDAIIALSMATGIYEEKPTGMDFDCADIVKNDKIDTNDARFILRTASGQEAKRRMEGYEFSENSDSFLKEVNSMRVKEGNSSLKLSKNLCNAAKKAAEEYATKTGTALSREDGSYYYTLLDESNIKYTFADKIIIPSSYSYKQTLKELQKIEQSKKALCNKNFKNLGIGAYTKDGRTFYWCIFLTD